MIVLLLATLAVAGGLFGARSYALRKGLQKAKVAFAKEWDADLTWSEPRWNGLLSFEIDTISARRDSHEMLGIHGLGVKANLAGLLTGGKPLRAVSMRLLRLHYQGGGQRNDSLKTARKLPHIPAVLADLPALVRWIPSGIQVDSVQMAIGNSLAVRGASFRWGESQLHFPFEIEWKGKPVACMMQGHVDPSHLEMQELRVGLLDKPWLVNAKPFTEGETWRWEVSISHPGGWTLQHPMIAPTELAFPSTEFLLRLAGNSESVSMEKGSQVRLNQLVMGMSGSHEFSNHDWNFGMDLEQQDAAVLLQALPEPNFFGEMKASGTIDMSAEAYVPAGVASEMQVHFKRLHASFRPDSSSRKNLQPNPANVLAVPFQLKPERSRRVLMVDRGAAHHLGLEEIPLTLQAAVIAAEDPNFRTHSGVDTTILRKALADNLSDGKFSRGGSTITMQLAKLLYLDSRKDLQRKANQILLAWMMEAEGKDAKDNLLELYLNVIEWGPDVYGVGEAAAFYFGKRPRELTLDESLFLASIIPNPSKYSAMLDETGRPTEQALLIFDLLKYQLWEQEVITDDQLDAEVRLLFSPKALQAH